MENTGKKATAGNTGDRVRSDCFITLELTNSGGIEINLKSKVKSMFGESIINLTNDIFKFFEIENAKIEILDKGALPFVLAARIENAIKQLVDTEKEYLLDFIEENKYVTAKDIFRFSRLYLPGNTPSMMLNAGIHNPNGIILDLEDSVAPAKKEEARLLIRNALRSVNFYGAERMVRINQGERGIEDLKYIVPHNVNLILVPKCESASEIHKIEEEINRIRKGYDKIEGKFKTVLSNFVNKIETTVDRFIDKEEEQAIYFMPIIESAMGVEKAFEIATASKNVVSLAIGLEDFTADLGVKRTKEAKESLYARMRIVNACKAARIQPIDSVFSDVADMEGLAANVKESRSLGFEGMGCIHPRQIKVIHENFAPEADEIEKAKKIVNAFIIATEKGLGVVSIGSKMIDPPVVKRAETTINLAINLGMLKENWREEYLQEQK